MKKIVITIATAAGMLMIASCAKEAANEAMVGTIRFGASTVYENGPATKTEYSGKDQNNNSISSSSTYERIDWLSTDKIRILCDQASLVSGSNHYADYSVSGISASSQKSTASITPADGNGLQWGTGTHHFYGYYPSAVQNSNATIVTKETNLATVGGTIPATQTVTLNDHTFKPNMDNAYMYAYASASSGGNVTLSFKPLFTAVEFTLLTDSTNPISNNKLTKVTLSSTQIGSYLAGNFSATLNQSASFEDLNVTSGSNSIDINIPGGGVDLSTSTAYTVTFLMLPQEQAKLTLTLTFADNSTKALKLKDDSDWVCIPACEKTYIWKLAAPKDVDQYVFTVTNPTDLVYSGGTSTTGSVVSYKYKDVDNDANRTDVAWEVDDYYESEADATAGTNELSGISATYLTAYAPSSTTGSYSGESVSITYSKGTGTSTTVDLSEDITAKLKSNTGAYLERGSSSSYWNLANPTTGEKTSIAETANTYIVNAPGYYCFPLVMGNGVQNNSKNTTAYQQTNFVNYKGTSLTSATSPFLNDQGGTPTSAYIVWEEADMVELSDKTNWTLPSGCITNTTMTIDGSNQTVYWLNFQINSNIKQGCIILAVTDGTDVMWSWNIWVTDYVPSNYSTYSETSDLADVECTYDASNNKVTFMPRNLGWVEGGSTTGTKYAEKSVFVRLKQTGTSNYVVMKVTKPEGSEVTGGSAGHSPYYQWGRKDALIPSNGTGNSPLTGLYGKTITFQNTIARQTLATAIKNPDRHYGYGSSPYDWCLTSDNGWWCAGNTQTSADKTTIKTIYDPSPAGYTIPRYNAFLGFRLGTSGTSPNVNGAFAKGYYFWNGYRSSSSVSTTGMKTIFFPAAGYRYFSNGVLNYVTTDGYYWCAVPYSASGGRRLYFISGDVFPQNFSNRSNGFSVRPARVQN